MKKIWAVILSLSTIFFLGNFTQANSEYEFTNLDITANVLIDGTIDVKEDYTANFFVHKHGFIRGIPVNYSPEGHDFHVEVSNIQVSGKNFTTSKNDGNIEIKIGDADTTLIGEQNYPISYSVYGLIRNFSGMGYSELYWNLVGYDFDTNINKVKAEIILPKVYTGFSSGDFLITTDGKSNTIDGFEGNIDWSQGDKIIITYDKGLPAYQGITLLIDFPNDYFEFDHDRQAKLIGNADYGEFMQIISKISLSKIGIMLIVVFTLLSAGLIIFLIRKLLEFFGLLLSKLYKNSIEAGYKSGGFSHGNFGNKHSIIVQYNPPEGLNSAEVGLLLHRKAEAKDMLSLIYKWAIEGLISISTEKTKGSLFSSAKETLIITKNKDINDDVADYEKDFFKSLIRGKKNKIEQNANLYKKFCLSSLEEYGKQKGRLLDKENIVFFLIVWLVGISILSNISSVLCILFFVGSIFLRNYFGLGFKFKETEEGAKLIDYILGYKKFLAACDENKLRLFLKKDPLYFDKILPYAVVFGLETELLKKIEPIMQEMNIKSSRYDGNLSSMYVINDVISSSARHSTPPRDSYSSSSGFNGGSGSSGGFSSGGGGGGGGGRSW